MARFAHIILAGVPYHATHRGNRRRAGLVARAEERPWSSAVAHVAGGAQAGSPLPAPAVEGETEAFCRLRLATGTGRPCGGQSFMESTEERLGRMTGARLRGRKPKYAEENQNQLELF